MKQGRYHIYTSLYNNIYCIQSLRKIANISIYVDRDLFDQQNLNDVVINLYAVSAISRKHDFGGPFIGLKYASKNKRHFTAEVLAKSKSSVPSWNKGSLKNENKNMDGYGIVKTNSNFY